jgi:hypothetical protein
MVIDYKTFNLSTAADSGGVTGSQRVKGLEGKNYQLKSSMRTKSKYSMRSIKAGGTDRENYGEVISAKIARAILSNENLPNGAPEVSLVYDKEGKTTPVASKYLEGEKIKRQRCPCTRIYKYIIEPSS